MLCYHISFSAKKNDKNMFFAMLFISYTYTYFVETFFFQICGKIRLRTLWLHRTMAPITALESRANTRHETAG